MILIFLRKCRSIVELGNLKDVIANHQDELFLFCDQFCGDHWLIGSTKDQRTVHGPVRDVIYLYDLSGFGLIA